VLERFYEVLCCGWGNTEARLLDLRSSIGFALLSTSVAGVWFAGCLEVRGRSRVLLWFERTIISEVLMLLIQS
jgi:hypothetical protein